jgi:hypothetical protein
MTKTRLLIFISGLLCVVGPAQATISYYSSSSSFASDASTDSLTTSSTITFTGSLSQFGSVANDEYVDLTTGTEFIAFNSTGTANEAFSIPSGGDLDTPASSGDAIEVVLPTGTYGFGINFSTSYPTGETLCMDSSPGTFSSCASGGVFVTSTGSSFTGVIDDAGVTTLWLHPLSGNPGTNLTGFEIATQGSSSSEAPEAGTLLTLGSGLVGLGLVRKRIRVRR